VQVFGSIIVLIALFIGVMWLRGKLFALAGNRLAAPGKPLVPPAAVSNLDEAGYERLEWELKQRGFAPRDPQGRYSDFSFSGQLAVEVAPIGALYRISIRNGAGRYAADEALRMARSAG
jgi:hypothetical protein